MKLAQRTKRFLALLLAFAMMMTSLVYADTEGDAETPADEPAGIEYVRVAGDSRYDTAIQSADALKGVLEVEKFENIIVASGTSFPDALAGSYLSAAKGNAPILLVANSAKVIDQVSKYVIDNLAENGTVYLLGGTAAVPADFREVLTDSDIKTKRLKGNDRFETNLAILKEAGIEDGSDLIVATGSNFADSLSASASGAPLLLVGRALTDAQKEFLASVKLGDIHIVGGEGVVLPAVAEELKEYAENVERIAGANRFETSTAIAAKFEKPEAMVLAYAQNFPDGLSAGPLAHALGAPLILTQNAQVAIDTAIAWRATQNIRGGFVIGGTALISDETADTIFNTAKYDRTTYYVLAGKSVGWNVTVGYTDETEDDALVCTMPGKKAGKHEVAVENCQWITLSGDNALDENNNFTFEIPELGVEKANISYLITAWTNEDATYADLDGTSQDLTKVEVKDYDESGSPVGDPHMVDAEEPYVLKVGETEYTPDTNAYGDKAIDASGVGSYTADIHFSKNFWNDWCAIVIVVEETVSGVAPDSTPTPEPDPVTEIPTTGKAYVYAASNPGWVEVRGEAVDFQVGKEFSIKYEGELTKPAPTEEESEPGVKFLTPVLVFDSEFPDAALSDLYDVEVKCFVDGEEVEILSPENTDIIWAEGTDNNDASYTARVAAYNAWGQQFLNESDLYCSESIEFKIKLTEIAGKAYYYSASNPGWEERRGEAVNFKIGEEFTIKYEGEITKAAPTEEETEPGVKFATPVLVFNEPFGDAALSDIYDVQVKCFVDGEEVEILSPENADIIWAEGTDGNDASNTARVAAYNAWGQQFLNESDLYCSESIEFKITLTEKRDGYAYYYSASNPGWQEIRGDEVNFKVGEEFTIRYEGEITKATPSEEEAEPGVKFATPVLVFDKNFPDGKELSDIYDVQVKCFVDGEEVEILSPENAAIIWAEDTDGHDFSNTARVAAYNAWGQQFLNEADLYCSESIEFKITLTEKSDADPGDDPDDTELQEVKWVGTIDYLAGEGNGYQDVTATTASGITLTKDQWRVAVTFSNEALAKIEEMEYPVLLVEREGNATIWGFGIEDGNWTYLAGQDDKTGTSDTRYAVAFDENVSYYIDVRDWETSTVTVSVVDDTPM